MQNSNYIILIDENGQPYLEHSIWDRAKSAYGSARSAAGKAYGSAHSAGNRAVKYIEKIGDGAKARYFYTQDELKAYYNKGKNAAKNAVNKAAASARDAIGITDREKRDAARREADAAAAKHFNAQQHLGNAKLARDRAKDKLDFYKGQNEEYLEERNGLIEKAKRALSADARDRDTKLREAHDAWVQEDTDAFLRANDDVKLAEVDARMKQREYEDAALKAYHAQNRYNQTPLGFITDVIPDAVDRAKEAASDAVDRAKEAASDAVDRAKEAASDAVDRTKTAASKALDFVNAHQEDRWADSKLGPLAQKAANLSEKVSEVQLSNQWAYDPSSNELVTAKKRTEDLYNSLDSLADKYTSERNPIKRVAYQREMERLATELNDIYEDALNNK